MDRHPECRCLICYCEGDFAAFSPKPERAEHELECPQCLNNDGDYIEKVHTDELVAV